MFKHNVTIRLPAIVRRSTLGKIMCGSACLAAAIGVLLVVASHDGGAVESVHAEGSAHGVFVYVADGRVRALESGSAVATVVGPPGSYDVVRLSQSGSTIAAVEGQSSGSQPPILHLIDHETGADRPVTLDYGPVADVVWSPTTDVVAILGSRIRLVDNLGRVVASSSDHSAIQDGAISIEGGGYAWGPDGRQFGAIQGGNLIVLGVNGVKLEAPVRGLPALDSSSQVVFDGWTATGEQLPVIAAGGRQMIVSAGGREASPVAGSATSDIARVVDQATRGRPAAYALAAGSGQSVWDRTSLDGNAVITQLVSGEGSDSFAIASLEDPSQFVIVSGLNIGDARGGALVDALITD